LRARGHGPVRKAAQAVKIGFYSPLPPARTGVADYSAALLKGLRPYGEIRTTPRRSTQCDVALYHLGNNSLHAGIYRQALEQPGVVVLHDAVLNHFLLGLLEQDGYGEEFVYNYGAWNRALAGELWQCRAGSASDSRYFQFPMLKRIAERSRAVIVHNPAAARAVKAHAPETAVVEIPHLFSPPELPSEAAFVRYRESLGFPAGNFVLGVFGYLRESKRLAAILDVFAALRRERAETALLIAGEFVSADLERALEPLLAQPGIVYRPRLSEREFWLAAGAVDACINLRYPSAGETSAIAIRLMGIGKPVLVTESEECARFPEDACLRIASGLEERDSLWSHLVLLTSVPGVSRAIGGRGAGYIHAHHQLEQVARQYWETLCAYRC
jgi:glycosyltransferase involved in cell wall biosynthesis